MAWISNSSCLSSRHCNWILAAGVIASVIYFSDSREVAPAPTTLPPLNFTTTTTPSGVGSFCEVVRLPVELEATDPSSVEAFYTAELSFQLLRRHFVPPELTEAADLSASDARRIIDALESTGWDLTSVDTTPSPAAAEAQRQLDAYFDANC